MNKIKIKILGSDVNSKYSFAYLFVGILKKYYDVEFSENPDYLFYNESTYEYLNYDCVKIFYTGENITPNFNFCDYAIGFDYMDFSDRYYRLPLYLVAVFYNKKEIEMAGDIYVNSHGKINKQDLSNKNEFCSFVYSNYLADNTRKLFFDKLNCYKKINSGGAYLNNIGYRVSNKLEFESKHKFSVSFENTSRSGYTTEKIVCSLVAKTIPIYWGNPDIGKEFNEKRFINCHNYKSFEDVVGRVKDIDSDDELYEKILNEPWFAEGYSISSVIDGFELFLKNLFDQPLITAKRRTINSVKIYELEKTEKMVGRYIKIKTKFKVLLSKFYRPFKRIEFLENFKQNYFKK